MAVCDRDKLISIAAYVHAPTRIDEEPCKLDNRQQPLEAAGEAAAAALAHRVRCCCCGEEEVGERGAACVFERSFRTQPAS